MSAVLPLPFQLQCYNVRKRTQNCLIKHESTHPSLQPF